MFTRWAVHFTNMRGNYTKVFDNPILATMFYDKCKARKHAAKLTKESALNLDGVWTVDDTLAIYNGVDRH